MSHDPTIDPDVRDAVDRVAGHLLRGEHVAGIELLAAAGTLCAGCGQPIEQRPTGWHHTVWPQQQHQATPWATIGEEVA